MREPIAALWAAVGIEAVPAAYAVAMALKALVHLALGQRQAHGALQGLGHSSRARGPRTSANLREVLIRDVLASSFAAHNKRHTHSFTIEATSYRDTKL